MTGSHSRGLSRCRDAVGDGPVPQRTGADGRRRGPGGATCWRARRDGNVPLGTVIGLFEQYDAQQAVELLNEGADLEKLRSDPPFDGFARFTVQVESIREVIREGSEATPEEPDAKDPVDMPSWRRVLSDREIDGIIAYLLTLQQWDDEEKAE